MKRKRLSSAAKQTIRRHRPVLQFESTVNGTEATLDIFSFFCGLGLFRASLMMGRPIYALFDPIQIPTTNSVGRTATLVLSAEASEHNSNRNVSANFPRGGDTPHHPNRADCRNEPEQSWGRGFP